ncbi:MAG: hypothetical protein ACLVB2_09655 [Clostridium fessum]
MKREKYEPVLKNISYFIKWAEGAIVIGIVSGCIGTAFGKCVLWVCGILSKPPVDGLSAAAYRSSGSGCLPCAGRE